MLLRLYCVSALVRAIAGCTCTGQNTGIDVATYGENYGTTCAAWEDGKDALTSAPSCNAFSSTGTWCCRPWCYVDPDTCNGTDYLASFFQSPSSASQATLYFSYDVCGQYITNDAGSGEFLSSAVEVTYTEATCPWQGPREYASCECTGLNPGIDGAKYGADYGKSCKAWEDEGEFTSAPSCNTFSSTGTWCCRAWCYIDPMRCHGTTTPFFASYFQSSSAAAEQTLYFSYAACDSGNAGENVAERTYPDASSCPWQGPSVFMPDVRVQAAVYDWDDCSFDGRFGCGNCGMHDSRDCLQDALSADGKPVAKQTQGNCAPLRDVTLWYSGEPTATVNLDLCAVQDPIEPRSNPLAPASSL